VFEVLHRLLFLLLMYGITHTTVPLKFKRQITHARVFQESENLMLQFLSMPTISCYSPFESKKPKQMKNENGTKCHSYEQAEISQ
jgi:hypothetical protein